MNKKFLILLLFVLVGKLFAVDNFNHLKESIGLNSGGKAIIFYQNLNDCFKCSIEMNNVVDLVEKGKNKNRNKIVCFVNCKRKKELDFFRKTNNWKHFLFINKDQIQNILKSDLNTGMIILDENFNVLSKLKYGEIIQNIKSINAILNN